MKYPKGKPARNVEAYDVDNNLLWIIEDLGGGDADCYTHISSLNGEIHAFNFMCYDCIVNENNGKIVSKIFTK